MTTKPTPEKPPLSMAERGRLGGKASGEVRRKRRGRSSDKSTGPALELCLPRLHRLARSTRVDGLRGFGQCSGRKGQCDHPTPFLRTRVRFGEGRRKHPVHNPRSPGNRSEGADGQLGAEEAEEEVALGSGTQRDPPADPEQAPMPVYSW
jgi:hypothetical protein